MRTRALVAAGSLFLIVGCVTLKETTFFLPEEKKDEVFHTSAEIYSEYMTSEAWKTHAPGCISVVAAEEAAYKGTLGLKIEWNAQGEGCPWIGFGFGWDAWTGKNIRNILNEGALEFWVRMEEGERANIPWALGFEDFTGAQAWLGMSENAIKGDKISEEWVRVELPLSEFNWREQDADASNIKQLIIQVQASGVMFIDEIRLVPYTTGYRKRATIPYLADQAFTIDGLKNDAIWQQEPLKIGENKVRLQVVGDYLHIAAEVLDKTPLQNNKTGDNTWNGDGLEFAFSTDPNLQRTRTHYFSTDQHIGFGLGETVTLWNYRTGKPIKNFEAATTKNRNGYLFEARVFIGELSRLPFIVNQLYGLEVAINKGTLSGRTEQLRWNDPANEGFHQNPYRWGELYIVKPGHSNLQ
ncbi:MAG: CBM9 family sugar-binding protein [Schleiferiaceae bacterium]|nr:CBM9 family sugar-binding protein [Schleiferiaceae bacterium]